MVLFPTDKIMTDYKLFWQYPVITEETFYNQNKSDETYIGFPWATIIDKKYNVNVIYQLTKSYIHVNKQYYTCCQHIHFRLLIDLFKALNITTIYSPHKIIVEDKINEIFIKPCPLYAANIEDPHRNQLFQNVDFMTLPRKYLYSFQGAYDKQWYLTDVREQLFNMKHPEDCYVKNIGLWHYNNIVYSNKQNNDKDLNENNTHINNTKDYNQLLLDSRFSLCPSGSGPNSIRLWESLAIGSIPIVLADTLDLPNHELWDKAILRIKESDISKIPEILSTIDETKEKEMRSNCIELYKYFKSNYRNMNISKCSINIDNTHLDTIQIESKNKTIILFTTHKFKINLLPTNLKNNINQWKILNHDFIFNYFDDLEMELWINSHLSKYELHCYNLLNSGAGKADFFRVAYIYYEGGIWIDADLPAFNILKHYDSISSTDTNRLYDLYSLLDKNHIIIVRNRKCDNPRYTLLMGNKNTYLFKKLLNKICVNILLESKNVIKTTTIHITGPFVLHKLICNILNIQTINELKLNYSYSINEDINDYTNTKIIKFIYINDIVPIKKTYDEENTYIGYQEDLMKMNVLHHTCISATK